MLKLSEGQDRIGRLVALGYSNREIAVELGVSEQAVKSSLHVIFDKIGCWNRVELANHFSKKNGASEMHLDPALASVLITSELYRRSPNSIDQATVGDALQLLADCVLQRDHRCLVRILTDIALNLCRAETSGLSILDIAADGSKIFRWDALSGALSHAVGGTTPRDWSPCGTTLDMNCPQLFQLPEKFFTYFDKARPQILEGLVLPLRTANGSEFGTLWIVSHSKERRFTSADVDIMTSLCAFAMAGFQLLGMGPADVSGMCSVTTRLTA